MTIKKCLDCGEEKKHWARGLCRKCYRKREYWAALADRPASQEKKVTQNDVADVVGAKGPLTASDVAKVIGCTRDSANYLLRVMEKQGLVQRLGKVPGATKDSILWGLTD